MPPHNSNIIYIPEGRLHATAHFRMNRYVADHPAPTISVDPGMHIPHPQSSRGDIIDGFISFPNVHTTLNVEKQQKKRRSETSLSTLEAQSSTDNKACKSNKKRFVWPESLNRDFIAAIFDIGLEFADTEQLLLLTSYVNQKPDLVVPNSNVTGASVIPTTYTPPTAKSATSATSYTSSGKAAPTRAQVNALVARLKLFRGRSNAAQHGYRSHHESNERAGSQKLRAYTKQPSGLIYDTFGSSDEGCDIRHRASDQQSENCSNRSKNSSSQDFGSNEGTHGDSGTVSNGKECSSLCSSTNPSFFQNIPSSTPSLTSALICPLNCIGVEELEGFNTAVIAALESQLKRVEQSLSVQSAYLANLAEVLPQQQLAYQFLKERLSELKQVNRITSGDGGGERAELSSSNTIGVESGISSFPASEPYQRQQLHHRMESAGEYYSVRKLRGRSYSAPELSFTTHRSGVSISGATTAGASVRPAAQVTDSSSVNAEVEPSGYSTNTPKPSALTAIPAGCGEDNPGVSKRAELGIMFEMRQQMNIHRQLMLRRQDQLSMHRISECSPSLQQRRQELEQQEQQELEQQALQDGMQQALETFKYLNGTVSKIASSHLQNAFERGVEGCTSSSGMGLSREGTIMPQQPRHSPRCPLHPQRSTKPDQQSPQQPMPQHPQQHPLLLQPSKLLQLSQPSQTHHNAVDHSIDPHSQGAVCDTSSLNPLQCFTSNVSPAGSVDHSYVNSESNALPQRNKTIYPQRQQLKYPEQLTRLKQDDFPQFIAPINDRLNVQPYGLTSDPEPARCETQSQQCQESNQDQDHQPLDWYQACQPLQQQMHMQQQDHDEEWEADLFSFLSEHY